MITAITAEIEMENVSKATLRQKPTFYPEITKNLVLEKCEFCEK